MWCEYLICFAVVLWPLSFPSSLKTMSHSSRKSRLEDQHITIDNNAEILIHLYREHIFKTLDELTPVPSVELHDVPRESVDEHLRLKFSSSKSAPRSYGDEWRRDIYDTTPNDELDDSLARTCSSRPSPSCVFGVEMCRLMVQTTCDR